MGQGFAAGDVKAGVAPSCFGPLRVCAQAGFTLAHQLGNQGLLPADHRIDPAGHRGQATFEFDSKGLEQAGLSAQAHAVFARDPAIGGEEAKGGAPRINRNRNEVRKGVLSLAWLTRLGKHMEMAVLASECRMMVTVSVVIKPGAVAVVNGVLRRVMIPDAKFIDPRQGRLSQTQTLAGVMVIHPEHTFATVHVGQVPDQSDCFLRRLGPQGLDGPQGLSDFLA